MTTPAPTVPPTSQQNITPEQAQSAFAGQMPTGTVSDSWTAVPVFTGRTKTLPGGIIDAPGLPGIKVKGPDRQEAVWSTAGQVAQEWFAMDAVERNRYKDTFILMGLINPQRATDSDYSNIWVNYAQQLAQYNQASHGTKITIGDLITNDLKKREENDPGLQELMKTGKRTTTKTSTNLQLSSQLDATALMDAAAKSLLGRGATPEESKRLLAAVNQLERANVEKTTMTQSTDMYGEVIDQSSETTGGVSAGAREQVAVQQAEANPEYGAYQAATTYMGSLMDMVYGKGY